jgi:hypothetical protein
MDDTFSFIAPVMPRRRVDPFLVRMIVAAVLVTVFVAAFGSYVVAHERAAEAERSRRQAEVATQEEARIADLAASVPAADPAVVRLLDEEARRAVQGALDLVLEIAGAAGTFAKAGPAELTIVQPSLLFVDGPSSAPTVVSVSAGDRTWGAASMGASGICYWVRTDAGGQVAFGTGTVCTGQAALRATDASW